MIFSARLPPERSQDNLFWISPSPEAFQRAAVRTVVQFPQNRFFLLARDSASGRSWAKYFWETLQQIETRARIAAGEIFLPEHGEDYGGDVRTILSSKAEICVSHLGGKEWIQFARAAKKQGYFKKIIHFELESASRKSWRP